MFYLLLKCKIKTNIKKFELSITEVTGVLKNEQKENMLRVSEKSKQTTLTLF